MSKILAIIPARKESKGILNKNFKKICGKPLIAWTIEAAIKSKYIDEIQVSTDCPIIKSISENYGLKIPNLRPTYLSKDNSSSDSVILYELDKKLEFDIVCMLQPTSPLRNYKDIDAAFETFFNFNADGLVSVVQDKHSPYLSFQVQKGYLKSVFKLNQINRRRQDLPSTFSLNGAIYIAKINFYKKHKTFLTKMTIPYIMESSNSIDIDDLEDFEKAEEELKRKMSEY